jgi:hypothetical protein
MQRRREAEVAALSFARTRHAFHLKTRSLRTRLGGSREAWIVGGGFASGALIALLPLRRLGGVLRLLASGVSFALRAPVATLFADAIANTQSNAPTDRNRDASVDS